MVRTLAHPWHTVGAVPARENHPFARIGRRAAHRWNAFERSGSPWRITGARGGPLFSSRGSSPAARPRARPSGTEERIGPGRKFAAQGNSRMGTVVAFRISAVGSHGDTRSPIDGCV